MSTLLILILMVLIPVGMIWLFRWLLFRSTGYDPGQSLSDMRMPRYRNINAELRGQPTQTKYDLPIARKSKEISLPAAHLTAVEDRAAVAVQRLEDAADDTEEPVELSELLKRDQPKR